MVRPRHITLAVLAAAVLLPAAPAAARSSCAKLPASATRTTTDPVAFQDNGRVTVHAFHSLTAVQVRIVKAGKVLARGAVARIRPGAATVPVRFGRVLGGRVQVVVTAKAAGCATRGRFARDWLFARAALPVIAGRPSAYVEDYGSSMDIVLRTVGGEALKDITAQLVSSAGTVVSSAAHPASFSRILELSLPLSTALAPGDYRLRLAGRAAGQSGVLRRVQPVSLRSSDGASQLDQPSEAPSAGPTSGIDVQHVSVDWSGGQWSGREVGGFVVPGMGYGEVVCRPNAQWIRFFSSETGRQIAMMNWTYRNWVDNSEYALREAVLTPNTGTEFNEGFNKFGPSPEKLSTGNFEGIISDRGPFGSAGGAGDAAPTTLSLAWSWDFSDPSNARCAVSASFATETDGTSRPLARGVSVNWKGDDNAPAHNGATRIVDGLGRIDVTCDSLDSGVRFVTITGPDTATITDREGSDETVTTLSSGPITHPLPNNGMLKFDFGSGRTLLLSSRWKTNDPDPTQNFCNIAGQAIVP